MRATPKQIREFFEEDGKYPKVSLSELSDFKKADPEGYDQVANGLGDGSLTY